jgi:hypothetical protein
MRERELDRQEARDRAADKDSEYVAEKVGRWARLNEFRDPEPRIESRWDEMNRAMEERTR